MNNKTERDFLIFVEETVPQQLFHVSTTDKTNGIRLDERILVGLIASNIWVLKFKRLEWLIDHFIKSEDKVSVD